MDSSPAPPAKPITVSSYGHDGASTRVRLADWFAHIGLESVHYGFLGRSSNPPREILKQPIAALRAEARLWRLADHVSQRTLLLGREATPFGRGGLEARLLSGAGRGIYDYDDALYVGYPRRFSALLRPIDRVWRKAVRAADIVIAGSDILAGPAEKLANEIVVIPSCIEPADYLLKSSYAIEKAPRAVWLGSPSTEPYLAMIAGPLLRLHRELGLRLTLISAGNRSHGQLDIMTDRVQWRPDRFAAELVTADIGIMPLPDDEWARGKCAYKLLQYAAAGLPTVGSAVGANTPALAKVSGTAVHAGDDWADAIRSILELGEAQRATMGAAARAGVIQHFSYGSWAVNWRAATGL